MKRYYSVTGSLLAFCWLFPVWALREFCVISQPKAGTNITAEVLQRATGKKRLPSVEPGGSGYFPSSEQFIQIINRGGYFPGAHAFYTDELYEAIAGAGIAIIFVQRDPRDVVVSFARWRKRENRFGNIDMASVSLGQLMSDFILSPYKWLVPPSRKKWYEVLSKVATNLKAFYEAYFGWRQREGVFVLRYEDLLGGPESSIGKRAETLRVAL